MYTFQHYKFITTPLSKILEDGVNASRGIGSGIETYPLCDYIMQSIFLKMTGAQEQKMKCICWELATNDYEYRYKYLKKNYGECSDYNSKNSVYSDIIQQITKLNPDFSIYSIMENIEITNEEQEEIRNNYINKEINKGIKNENKRRKEKEKNILTEDEKNKMRLGMQSSLQKKMKDINISELYRGKRNEKLINQIVDKIFFNAGWNQKEYKDFQDNYKKVFCPSFFITSNNGLFAPNLQNHYDEIVYKHRNRCAHNLTSYQQDLPTLSTLANPDYIYHNYFFRFAILILIDEIFICLYKKYVEALENNINW